MMGNFGQFFKRDYKNDKGLLYEIKVYGYSV